MSASIAASERSLTFCPSSAKIFASSHTSSYPFLPLVRFATIATRAPLIAEFNAATLPPPGAGVSVESSSQKPFKVRSTSLPSSAIAYSMILSFKLNGASSSKPIDWTAVSIIIFSGKPALSPIFLR